MSKKNLFAVLCFCLLFEACNNSLTGGSTETSSKVASMLYNPGGTPAAYAMVHFYPRDYNPQTGLAKTTMVATIDSTTTDANGNYAIILNTGAYTILANSDSGLAYQDSIPAKGGATIHPPACTLKTPGTLHGVVQIQPGDDARTVFILFLGTHSYTTPDDAAGNFTTEPMAEGKYRVRILTTLPDYQVMDTSFTIKAGKDSVLADMIKLKYTGIPTPKGLSATYDTAHGVVTLRWDIVSFQALKGYFVYRNDTASTLPVQISGNNAVTDTFFNDTVFHDLLDTNNYVYAYRVKVQDTNANIGDKFSDPCMVTAASPTKVRTFLTLKTINTINDTASINDSVKVIVSYRNQTRYISRISWYVGRKDSLVKERSTASLAGSDTVMNIWQTPGDKKVFVKVQDTAGAVWEDSVDLTVISGKWEYVGSPSLSVGGVDYLSFVIADGIPYLAYQDFANGGNITVLKFNGSTWDLIGAAGSASDGMANYVSLAVTNGVPYVAYMDGSYGARATVRKYDGSNWVAVGTPGFAGTGGALFISIAIINNVPYIAYSDHSNGEKATVMKYNGSDWVGVGTLGFSMCAAYDISLVISDSTPYIAYQDMANNGKATVMKYDGNAWVCLGMPAFSVGEVSGLSLVFDNGIPYVAYSDYATGYKANLMKYNGGAWVAVGRPNFSDSVAIYTSLSFFNGVPYLAFSDGSVDYKATVMKYDGSVWQVVGSSGISIGRVQYLSLIISNGVPYVAYEEGGNNYNATVMRFR